MRKSHNRALHASRPGGIRNRMHLARRWTGATVAAFSAMLAAVAAHAQQLVYTPVNPTFGGNPFNSSHLLGIANAENQFVDRSTHNLTQAQLFAQQLQSRLLSSLADQVTQAIFGTNAQNSGSFSFGGTKVSFVRDLNGVTVTITDDGGSVTTITLPNSELGH